MLPSYLHPQQQPRSGQKRHQVPGGIADATWCVQHVCQPVSILQSPLAAFRVDRTLTPHPHPSSKDLIYMSAPSFVCLQKGSQILPPDINNDLKPRPASSLTLQGFNVSSSALFQFASSTLSRFPSPCGKETERCNAWTTSMHVPCTGYDSTEAAREHANTTLGLGIVAATGRHLWRWGDRCTEHRPVV